MRKKYISPFVKRMNEIKSKEVSKLLWLSRPNDKLAGITYVKKLHGELK
jgi:hypothetical protein